MGSERPRREETSDLTAGRAKRNVPIRWIGLAVALAVAAVVVVGVGIRLQSGGEVVAPSGHVLGRLPAGVGPGDLSLLLITLDTTRADRIGAYGFADIETPHMDRLAAEGVLFEQAEAVAPLTLPAHSSIFTGQFPPAHGVRDNGAFYLGDEHVVLAEILRDEGWRTGGFVGAFVLDAKWGIAQGFDHYFDDFDLSDTVRLALNEIERPAGEVTDAALTWLDEAPEARFFSWVHFYDPHSPYEPPEPFAGRYRNRPYIGEIAYVDSQVGRLLDWLDQNGRADDTVVIVIGDHGESLGEHGESGHGFFVYEGATRVPFILRAPYDTMRGRRIGDVVRAVDVSPTVLDLLAVDAGQAERDSSFEGASIVRLLTGASGPRLPAYAEAVYPRYHYGWSDLAALRVENMKYVAAPRPELYDLAVDPDERNNLYAARPDEADRMASMLQSLESRWADVARPAAIEEIDPETRTRLAALGYLASFGGSTDESVDRALLADPKDRIHLYNLMRDAREASLQGNRPAAVEALERVLIEDPSVIDAWVRLGDEQVRDDDTGAAIESYRRAIELKPDYAHAVINLANAYRRAGAEEEAMLGYREFLRLDPRNAIIHYELARMLVDLGDLEGAEEHLREAADLSPEMGAAVVSQGAVALLRSDLVDAERLFEEALTIQPDVRLAHFNLALLAEQRGDPRAAADFYRRELDVHPQSYRVQFNLGRLLDSLGDRYGAAAALEQSIEINPEFAVGHFFLAKSLVDRNEQLDRAIELARTGLELDPGPDMAPMGHYLLADIYTRLGQPEEARRELASARALERRG
ncbi:MAG: sulfatase-like hydrolase/transferase [Holophagales bacterium]|nr:sulfatase-like hydrolase/transferase [Holophagales bacterium]